MSPLLLFTTNPPTSTSPLSLHDALPIFLNSMAAAALENCEVPVNGNLRFLTLDSEVWLDRAKLSHLPPVLLKRGLRLAVRSEEHTSDSSHLVISYAVFCL